MARFLKRYLDVNYLRYSSISCSWWKKLRQDCLHFSFRNISKSYIPEAMQAALILAVKNPRGSGYENFATQVKLKTSKSPFFSMAYNKSNSAFANSVSTNISRNLFGRC